MMQSQSIDLSALLQEVLLEARAAWRYRWLALIVAWCVMLVGALLVFGLPNKYESSAQVYADTEAMSNPLLRGIAVQPDVDARLRIITHTLLSRPNLESVAEQTGLSLRATTPDAKNALLVKLGATVKIASAGTANLYNLSYSDPDPAMAQKVVQALLQILMNNTLGANNASTQTAQSFLQQQVTDYGQRLNDAEQKLAEFKRAHVGYIPDQGGSGYFERLQAAETRLQDLQSRYDTAVAGRATIRQQMQAMASAPGPQGIDPRTQEIDQQIATYKKHLDKLLLTYTEQYPDVISTRRMIAELQARRKALRGSPVSSSAMGVASDNPVYQDMQKSLYTNAVSIKTLTTQIALQKQQIAGLKGNVDTMTGVQADLQQLTRNYTVTKTQYDELMQRLNTAQLSQDATQSGNNLKFRVIDPPMTPLQPASPKRGLLLLLVFVFAAGFGGAFAYFMHMLRPVFIGMQRLQQFGGFPVLGSISVLASPARERERHREVIGLCAGAGMLVVVLALGVVFSSSLAHVVQHFLVLGGT